MMSPMSQPPAHAQRGFASDNYAGIHPEVLAAMVEANNGHATAYGDDVYSERMQQAFRNHLGEGVQAFPVFNGTGANVTALQAVLRPWEAVLCASSAHINVDEGGAPEHLLGVKLIDMPAPDGKLTPELVQSAIFGVGVVHHSQPRVISITQTTELGTAYSADEIKALADFAHANNLYLHVDGARISNAAASLNQPFREFTTDAGVDLLSFGGTKNGLMGAEAIIVFERAAELGEIIPFARKNAMQLASKMRFISVQFVAMLEGDLWQRTASHANQMAQRLRDGVQNIPGLTVSYPVQANAVFVELPHDAIEPLQQVSKFYVWNEALDQVRWMCAWDTTEDDIDSFVDAVRKQLS